METSVEINPTVKSFCVEESRVKDVSCTVGLDLRALTEQA